MDPIDHNQKLKQALQNWASVTQSSTEIEIVKGLFKGASDTSPIIDRFSIWLLVGTGATASLMIANVASLIPVLGSAEFKISIYVLVISGLFGFLAKKRALDSQVITKFTKVFNKAYKRELAALEKENAEIMKMAKDNQMADQIFEAVIDGDEVARLYAEAFPKIVRPRTIRSFKKGTDDRLLSTRKNASNVYWQLNYTFMQSMSFLFFLIYVVFSIKV